MAHETTVMWILWYENKVHTFAEAPIRVRHFPTWESMDKEISHLKQDPEIRIVKAMKQTTVITREMIIDYSQTTR